MKKIIISTLIAGGALLAPAFAGTTVTASIGDLLVGFYATGGQGSDTNVVINAGSYTNFFSGNGATTAITGFNSLDLVNTYGSTWYNRTDLVWGVIGTTAATASLDSVANYAGAKASKDTLFATSFANPSSFSAQSQGTNSIVPIYGTNSTATAGAGSTTFIQTSASSTSTSFVFQQNTAANSDFKFFADGSLGLNLLPGAGGSVSQTLYEIIPTGVSGATSGTYTLGTFNLTSSGLTFTAASAVPEPSTYAAIFGAVALGYVTYRRRRKAVAA